MVFRGDRAYDKWIKHMENGVGRKSMGLKQVLVGLSVEALERMDARVGARGRSAFVREVVDAALGLGAVVPSVPKPAVPSVPVTRVPLEMKDGATATVPADAGRYVQVVLTDPVVVKPSAAQAAYDARWAEDDAAVREYLVGKVRTERDIALALGWAPMRASRSLKAVVEAGTVVVERGSYRLAEGA
jgi:hypothetical protein